MKVSRKKRARYLLEAEEIATRLGVKLDSRSWESVWSFLERHREDRKKSSKPKPAKQKRAYWVDPKSDEFLLSWEWKKLRMKVLVKYGATCMCCGASKDDGVRIHVDHIKPRSKFPKLALVEDNLQVLCDVCNQGKSNIDMTDWRPKGGTGYDPAKQFGEFMQINGK